MLQTVILPSIERSEIALPVYSITDPVPPPAPISPIMERIMSFAVTPSGAVPPTLTLKFFALGIFYYSKIVFSSLISQKYHLKKLKADSYL